MPRFQVVVEYFDPREFLQSSTILWFEMLTKFSTEFLELISVSLDHQILEELRLDLKLILSIHFYDDFIEKLDSFTNKEFFEL